MPTIKEVLTRHLSAKVLKQALAEIPAKKHNAKTDKPVNEILQDSFIWADSKQGESYWDNVSMNHKNKF